MSSKQVQTTSLLRQFATEMGDGEIAVTSKLGINTLSRVRFKQIDYPSVEADQVTFLRCLVTSEFPNAGLVLDGMFEQCLLDQAKAVSTLLLG